MSDDNTNMRSAILSKTRQLANLEHNEDQSEPNPKSKDIANTAFGGGSLYQRNDPPKDRMRKYWRQFETTPMIRSSITSFAQQVIEPGYRVESSVLSEEQRRQLIRWLRRSAITEGQVGKDITALVKKAAIQREVRGTALIEIVPAAEDEEMIADRGAMKLLNPETVDYNTKPNQAMLIPPDSEIEGIPRTSEGDAAAYIQETSGGGEDVLFSRDEVVKITRDADVGDIYGTSRIEAVSDRIDGLKKKLHDNDEAIASKAYPLWLFLFGTEENPWNRDDIDTFMRAHEMGNFHPGMKQGVRGDVDIKQVSGEVAEIAEYLQFDLDYIMTAMPLPKYALGAFESNINQFVSRTQERSVNRQIKESRREIEEEFSPIVQRKAREMFGLSHEDSEKIMFRLGMPNEEGEDQPNTNVIRYVSDSSGDEDDNDPDSSSSTDTEDDPVESDDDEEENRLSPEELADPRIVSSTEEQDAVSTLLSDVLKAYRNEVIEELRDQYPDAPRSAMIAFDGISSSKADEILQRVNIEENVNAEMVEVVENTLNTLGQSNQSVTIDSDYGFRHRQNARDFSQSVVSDTRRAIQEFGEEMSQQIEQALSEDASLEGALSRVESSFTDERLEQRGDIISHMQIQRAIEQTKMREYERSGEVAAVKVVNANPKTRVCKQLTNGENAIAEMGENLSEQWRSEVTAEENKAFSPFPETPPFHYGCDSELVPLSEEELESYSEYTVEELEEKYGVKVVSE